jgi:hypothetical protein
MINKKGEFGFSEILLLIIVIVMIVSLINFLNVFENSACKKAGAEGYDYSVSRNIQNGYISCHHKSCDNETHYCTWDNIIIKY